MMPERAPGLAVDRVGGDLPELERVLRLRMGAGADKFAPISAEVHRDFAALLAEGLALLDAGLPSLAGEIRAILSQVLLAQAPAGATMEFDGASHYQFWGLLFLNPRHHRTPLAVAEVLAHEAGHSLLFGLTVDEALVRNPDEDLFASPLRRDPRPMDGIYHATFVSARMAWAMEGLAASGLLSAVEREAALAAAAADRANFAKGVAVVDAYGDLTPTGRKIIENARAWVEAG
jgi:HEXXH motif-containing protein